MAGHIVSNNLPDPAVRQAIDAAILSAVGNRPGKWTGYVFTPQVTDEKFDINNWYVRIEGPKNFRWERSFCSFEHDPKLIHDVVQEAVSAAV